MAYCSPWKCRILNEIPHVGTLQTQFPACLCYSQARGIQQFLADVFLTIRHHLHFPGLRRWEFPDTEMSETSDISRVGGGDRHEMTTTPPQVVVVRQGAERPSDHHPSLPPPSLKPLLPAPLQRHTRVRAPRAHTPHAVARGEGRRVGGADAT